MDRETLAVFTLAFGVVLSEPEEEPPHALT